MTISHKLMLNLLLLLILLLAINLIIGYHQIYIKFKELEESQLWADVERTMETLDREIQHLDRYTNDWSTWDDTWDFMETESPEYIESNLSIDTSIIGEINLMSFIRLDGTPQWQMVTDLEKEEEIHLEKFPADRFPSDINMPGQNQSTRGFYVFDNKIIVLAIRGILKTDHTGPVNGYLAFGRILTEEMIKTLSGIIHVDFDIYPLSASTGNLNSDELSRLEISGTLEQRSSENLVLYTSIEGMNGTQPLVLEVRYPREIMTKGRLSFIYFSISTIAGLLLIAYLILRFIKKEILMPVNNLIDHMDIIHKTGDLSTHIMVTGDDEFSRLSREFNALLKIIETQTNQLKEQNQALEEQASRDELTGLFNKRYFKSALKRYCHENQNEKRPTAMVMMDIDHFKFFNDVYGHMAGDGCILNVAKVIREIVTRPTDLAARYGGEEFILFLQDTDRDGAVTVAKKIQKSLLELKIENQKSTVSPYLTMSIGICCGKAGTTGELKKLIEKADQALYRSKGEGRNRITVDSDQSFD